MKQLFTTLLLIITMAAAPLSPVAAEGVVAPPPNHTVIAAIQTGQKDTLGNDFAEIYNPTDSPVDITGWKLQYRAAASTGSAAWTTKKVVTCMTVPADGSPCQVMLLAKNSLVFATYNIPNVQAQQMSSGFSNLGGQVRLIDADALVQDMVGYGTAAEAEGDMAAEAPPLGQVLLRKVEAGQSIDTNINGDDFLVGCYQPAPQGEIMPMQPPAPADCPDASSSDPTPEPGNTTEPTDPSPAPPSSSDTDQPTDTPVTFAPLRITELLPDPASPQTDSKDEFVELHNPTAQPVSAEGYMLEAGSDFRYRFTLGSDTTIASLGYTAIMSAESHISLTNSGTAVRLLDPNGTVIDQITNYGQAKSGQAWANINGVWRWTTTPTPNQPNVFTEPTPPTPVAKTTEVKKTTTTKTTTKAAPTKTAKLASAISKAATKPPAKAASSPPPLAANQKDTGGNQEYLLLIPVVLLAVGYVVYEYRQDIAKWFRKTKQTVANKDEIEEPTPQTD